MSVNPEIIYSTAAFSILLLYHLHLIIKVRTNPMETAFGITRQLRHEWAKSIIAHHKDVAAVQTFRNHIMAASFLASTAILISLGVLGLTTNPDLFSGATGAIYLLSGQSNIFVLIKFIILALDLFFSFFNFTLTIRYYNHASYVISLSDDEPRFYNPEFLSLIMLRANLHYFIGMRGLYLTIPLFLWVFGGTWLLFGMLILVMAVYGLDRRA